MRVDAVKVLIYAVWKDRLLVFDEPDFPRFRFRCRVVRLRMAKIWRWRRHGSFSKKPGWNPVRTRNRFSHDYCFQRNGQVITIAAIIFYTAFRLFP